MTGWWGEVTGDPKKAFTGGFEPIPEGEMVTAELSKAELTESEKFGAQYEFGWKINDGDFKNRLVFQKIKAFDSDLIKAEKAQEMLMLLFKLFHVNPTVNAPTNHDLAHMLGRVATLKVGKWNIEGKSGNFVREVHDGKLMQGAMSRNQSSDPISVDDVPF